MVQQRAGGCCEYCRIHEDDVLAPHEPDHIIAEQHGGQTKILVRAGRFPTVE